MGEGSGGAEKNGDSGWGRDLEERGRMGIMGGGEIWRSGEEWG